MYKKNILKYRRKNIFIKFGISLMKQGKEKISDIKLNSKQVNFPEKEIKHLKTIKTHFQWMNFYSSFDNPKNIIVNQPS